MGEFVTASQAQRKFFTKIISKVTKGSYRLGAVRSSFLSGLGPLLTSVSPAGFCQHRVLLLGLRLREGS